MSDNAIKVATIDGIEDPQQLLYLAYKRPPHSSTNSIHFWLSHPNRTKAFNEFSIGNFETINESNFHLNDKTKNLLKFVIFIAVQSQFQLLKSEKKSREYAKMVVAVKVFKKTTPNGKITVYLGKRDFIDHG